MDKMIILTVDKPLPDGARGALPQGGLSPVAMPSASRAATATVESVASIGVQTAELNEAEQADLDRDPNVYASSPVMPLKLIEPTEASDTNVGPQPATGQATWGVEATGADQSSFDGAGVTVAVLDTGIEKSHPAFDGISIVDGSNYVDFTGEGLHDAGGHGTHCAGTAFGRDVNGTRIGVARGVEDVLIGKVLGDNGGGTDALIAAMDWAVRERANVISMSLGYDFPGLVDRLVNQGNWPVDLATSLGLSIFRQNLDVFNAVLEKIEAIARASGSLGLGDGTLVVAASGNESQADSDPDHRLPASLPSASAGVMSVAALGQGAPGGYSVAGFSNGAVTIGAPGVGVTSAALGGGLVSWNGTSMATPHVAGLAALWFEKERATGPNGLVDRVTAGLIGNADPSQIGGADQYAYGSGMAKAP